MNPVIYTVFRTHIAPQRDQPAFGAAFSEQTPPMACSRREIPARIAGLISSFCKIGRKGCTFCRFHSRQRSAGLDAAYN
jgi:hypothetical protein